MPAAPVPINEGQRLGALRACRILDTPPERVFDGIVMLASQFTGAPIALLSLVDESRQWFKARIGLEATETSRASSFCAHAILASGALVVEDALRDERFHDNPLVTGPPCIRFYAGCPLELSDGLRLGTLCVIETRARTLSADESRVLMVLAEQAAAQLELRRSFLDLSALRDSERHRADRVLEARATESFRIGRRLRSDLTETLVEVSEALNRCAGDRQAMSAGLRDTLVAQSRRIAKAARECRALASRIRAFSLLDTGWLATIQSDIVQLRREHRVHVELDAATDPDQVLPYATAQRLLEFVDAALLAAVRSWGARRLSLIIARHGSVLSLTVRHDGDVWGGPGSATASMANLRMLALELGSSLRERPHGDLMDLSVYLAIPPLS